MSALVYIYVV